MLAYKRVVIAASALAGWAIMSLHASAGPVDRPAQWFASGRCMALDTRPSQNPPLVKGGQDTLNPMIPAHLWKSGQGPWYVYDPALHIALRHVGQDSGITNSLRFSGPPPAGVPSADLRSTRTASGVRLGMSAAAVVAKLGKPLIVRGCGVERYMYVAGREAEDDDLDFTIRAGQIIEIYSTLGG